MTAVGKKLWQGALYLSLAAIFIKILSAAYRVPFQNIAGDVGFYVYQQVYPLYGIAIMLATFGFPVIISKLIAENNEATKQILVTAFLSLFLLSGSFFIVVFFSAPYVSYLIGDEGLQQPLRAIAFIFFVIPLLSVLRGYFQGNEEMLPTALSQVTEQFIRVVIILSLTYFYIANGYGPYAAGTGAAVGSVVGGLFGSAVLIYYYIKTKRNSNEAVVQSGSHRISLPLMKTIIVHGSFICFSSLILIFFQFVDSVTLLRLLLSYGIELEVAKASKGIYDRGQPLIQMGTVITTSFSLIVVPLISKFRLEQNKLLIQQYSRLAIKMSYIVGGAATIGLMIIIEPTNMMLFKDDNGSSALAILSISIVLASIFLTSASILHGLNKVSVTVVAVIIGILTKITLNLLLIPKLGLQGAAVATVCAILISAIVNVFTLKKVKVLAAPSFKKISRSFLALLILAIVTYSWQHGITSVLYTNTTLHERFISTIIALTSVCIGAVSYFFALIWLRLISSDELQHIPKLNKLAKYLKSNK